MHHTMRLNDEPFQKLASGQKTIELRLYDDKRRRVAVGDIITFTRAEGGGGTLTMRVKALHVFTNFAALYAALPLDKCGYAEDEIAAATPDDMLKYYSPEDEARYGVVGIEVERV